jgi:hypothetical protein
MTFTKTTAICAAAFGAVLTISAMVPEPAVAEDRRVRIINSTHHTMVQFYASNSSRTSWEEDILGQRVLPAGQSVMVNIDDGSGACLYDFKAVFDDGDVLTRSQINVCQISEYRYTE